MYLRSYWNSCCLGGFRLAGNKMPNRDAVLLTSSGQRITRPSFRNQNVTVRSNEVVFVVLQAMLADLEIRQQGYTPISPHR